MALVAWLVSPLVLTLLGMSATGVLIWFAGPLLHFGQFDPLATMEARLLAIVALLSIWGVIALIGVWMERRRNGQMVEQLATDAEIEAEASAAEQHAIQERFRAALATLKSADGKRRLGGRWVYQLPWYLIIGPPGSGKTTALQNAGLRFPLAERLGPDAVAGCGGTRHCEWWFTDEAVLIDTAGRYTTQDSDRQVDQAGWQKFLALLKQYRPRRPLNGVVVAMSVAELLQQPQVDRERQALAIRQRVQELCQTFQVALPVYVVLTKSDLVAGFSEFFADLGQEGREQVWGMTLPLALEAGAPAPLSVVGLELTQLQQRLNQRLLARLEQEREPTKRTFLFTFPTQFAALTSVLEPFLTDIFTPSRFEMQPLWRGVYFTSGTQTGTPIDRILGAYAANFGLGRSGVLPFKGTGKSYFLTRLLREVVFAEAGLVGIDPRRQQRRRWQQRGVMAVIALLGISGAGAWTTSYLGNQALIAEVTQRVTILEGHLQTISADPHELLGTLPLLDAARTLPFGYTQHQLPVEWHLGLGLYQGEKLGEPAQRTYRHLLERVLLPRVMWRLEEQLRQASGSGTPQLLYDTLRVYLLLGNLAAGTGEVEANIAAVRSWIEQDWQQQLPTATTLAQREALRGHLAALLDWRVQAGVLALNQAVIEAARARLNRAPLTERLYEQLKRDGIGAQYRDFTISAAAGEYAPVVLVRRSGRALTEGIPALYTVEGYYFGVVPALQRLLDAAAADSWVLGAAAQLQPGSAAAVQLLTAVRERYVRDYVTVWQALLDDVAVVAGRDVAHTAQVLNVLADPVTSPWRRLLVAAAAQTELDKPPQVPVASNPLAAGGLMSQLPNLKSPPNLLLPTGSSAKGGVDERTVTQQFKWLHDLVRANAQGRSQLDQVQTSLGKLELHLTAVAAALTAGRATLVAETTAIAETKALAQQLPLPVQSVVATLAQDAATLTAGGMRAQLNRLWTSEIVPFCQEAINDRYPFVKDSARETTLFDFSQLLGPGGMIDAFFQQHLAPLVNTSRAQWTWTEKGIGIPLEVLAQFQRAQTLRNTFFSGEGKLPAVQFSLLPLRMDARAIQLLLDVEGQTVDYRQGPPRRQQLLWPAPESTGRVRLAFTDTMGIGSSVTEEGAWAWFRVLERSALKPTQQAEKFQVTFALGELSAQFELRAASVRNPFNVQELRAFRCPERL